MIVTLLHYLWEYLKDNYSTKKVKDLVNTQIERYKNIASTTIIENGSLQEDSLSESEKASMQEELQQFVTSLSESPNQ